MKKFLSKIVAMLLTVCLSVSVLSAFACKGGGGSLKFESMSVSTKNVQLEYKVGDPVNFTGITATLKYNDSEYDKTVGYESLEFVYPDGLTLATLTQTSGKKNIKVSYNDSSISETPEKRWADFNISVVNEREVAGTNYYVEGFSLPVSYASYITNVANAGKEQYGSTNFEGDFFGATSGMDTNYYVGSQNTFKFVPMITVSTEEYGDVTLDFNAFSSNISVSVWDGDSYVDLTKTDMGNDRVAYSDNGVKLLEVDTFTHSYNFLDVANGKKIKATISPDNEYYEDINGGDVAPVSFEAVVIDAFNVYTADELSAFDNRAGFDHSGRNVANPNWDNFKAGKDLTAENGIVLHNDITILKENTPDSFYWTYDGGYTYKDNKTVMDTFLFDDSSIYSRLLTPANPEFNFIGNYFTIDAENMPVIASPGVNTDTQYNYIGSYSNAQLFDIQTTSSNGKFVMKNVNIKGNAHISELTDQEDWSVYGGGLILMRTIRDTESATTQNMVVDVKNVITKTFFIGYKPQIGTKLNLDYVKNYDSCFNAIFATGDSNVTITNSYMQRAGGPLIILQYKETTTSGIEIQIPVMNASNSVLESYVSGGELWFSSVNADSIVQDAFLPQNEYFTKEGKTFISQDTANNRNGKFNLVCVSILQGDNATQIISKFDAQAYFKYDYSADKSVVLDRLKTSTMGANLIGAVTNIYLATQQTPVLLSVDTDPTGIRMVNPLVKGFVIPTTTTLTTPVNTKTDTGMVKIFDSDFAVFTMGGFSMIIQLFDYVAQ